MGTSSAGEGGETTYAVTATATVPAATFFARAETTRTIAADFFALFVKLLRVGAEAPTSAASAGAFATCAGIGTNPASTDACATGGPATGGPAWLPPPSLAVAQATPATAAKSTCACTMGGPCPVANAITGSSAVHNCTAPWTLGATHRAGARLSTLVGEGAGATLPCNDLGRRHHKKRIVLLEVSC